MKKIIPKTFQTKTKNTIFRMLGYCGSIVGIGFADFSSVPASIANDWTSYNSYSFITIQLDQEKASTFGDLVFLDPNTFLDISSHKTRGNPSFLAIEHALGINVAPYVHCYYVGYLGFEKRFREAFFSERFGAVLHLPKSAQVHRSITSELIFGSSLYKARSLLAHSLMLSVNLPIKKGAIALTLGAIHRKTRFRRKNTEEHSTKQINFLRPGSAIFVSPTISYSMQTDRKMGASANFAFLMSDRNESNKFFAQSWKMTTECFYVWTPDENSTIKITYQPTYKSVYSFGKLAMRVFYIR